MGDNSRKDLSMRKTGGGEEEEEEEEGDENEEMEELLAPLGSQTNDNKRQ